MSFLIILFAQNAAAGGLHIKEIGAVAYISNISKPMLPKRIINYHNANKKAIKQLISRKAVENGINPNLLMAIAKVESDFNPTAVSKAGAIGLMQMMPETAVRFGVKKKNLYKAAYNLDASIRYIRFLMKRFDKQSSVVAAYYGGENSIHGNVIKSAASKKYMLSVLGWKNYYDKHGF